MIRAAVGSLAVLLLSSIALPLTAEAAGQRAARGVSCAVATDLLGTHESCTRVGTYTNAGRGRSHEARTRGASVAERPACAVRVDGYCQRGVACTAANNLPGSVYIRYEQGAKYPVNTCRANPRTPTDRPARPVVTDAHVAQAMRRLTWPTPRLAVQPPGGRTLVNLPTNLYTPDDTPRRLSTTLLTQTITIEATPVRYRWNLGTDEPPLITTDPGAPYPDLRVTHRYTRTGTHRLSLAVTYTGRWRASTDPAGQWRPIPGTLTLTTAAQPLQVIEATPQLRGY